MKRLLAFCLLGFFISSCQSAKKPVGASGSPGSGAKAVVPTAAPLETSPVVKGSAALLARALTAVGDNRGPRFSPDGSKILFMSSLRPSHKQWQVYELDLTRMTERRVTFHDGDDEGAGWAAGGQKIVYSSVTDEMKEDVSMKRLQAVYDASRSAGTTPNGIRSVPTRAGGDVYLQRLDGRDIERITNSPAADISPTADASTKSTKIVFTSDRDGTVRLYLYDGHTTKPMSRGGDTSPSLTNDGKALVWERSLAPKGGAVQTQLVMTDNFRSVTPLTSPGFFDHSPIWNAKGDLVIFASDRGGKTYDLYTIDRNGSCLKRLTQSKVNLSFPSLSPDGSKIAFSAKAGGQNQIYLMDNHGPELPCLAPIAAATPAPVTAPPIGASPSATASPTPLPKASATPAPPK